MAGLLASGITVRIGEAAIVDDVGLEVPQGLLHRARRAERGREVDAAARRRRRPASGVAARSTSATTTCSRCRGGIVPARWRSSSRMRTAPSRCRSRRSSRLGRIPHQSLRGLGARCRRGRGERPGDRGRRAPRRPRLRDALRRRAAAGAARARARPGAEAAAARRTHEPPGHRGAACDPRAGARARARRD